jgi:GntR family transcriptional repressor for pyruvate dehydrogenase complex
MHYYLSTNGHGDNPMNVIEARLMIEPTIAENAAINHNDEDIALLQKNIDEMRTNVDKERHAQLDLQFHQLIAEATRNPILPLIIQPIHKLMPKIKSKIMASVPEAKSSAVEWHQKVLDMIKERDPKGAYNMMKQHLTIAKEHTQLMILNEIGN